MEVRQIPNIILKHANGEEEFASSFAKLCQGNYVEFYEKAREAHETMDYSMFRLAAHKIQTMNVLFELDGLHAFLVGLMASEEAFLSADVPAIISDFCKPILSELKNV